MTEEAEVQPVAPVRPRTSKRKSAAPVETPEFQDTLIATDDKEDYELIRMYDNEDMPPTGQPFGVNGRFFVLRSNVWYRVPSWLLSSIDNCVVDRPIKDEADRLVGTRAMKRFPYEIFRG